MSSHDPLWAVTKPNPADRPTDESVSETTTVEVPSRPAKPRHELDDLLASIGVAVDDMPTVQVPAMPGMVEAPTPAVAVAAARSTVGDEPTLAVAAVSTTADVAASAPPHDDDATVSVPALAMDGDPVASTAAVVADAPGETTLVAEVAGDADADAPTVAVPTGFASDPLHTVALPAEKVDPRTELMAVLPANGNTAIITTPLYDPTPPGGRRIRLRRHRSWRRRLLVLIAMLLTVGFGYYVISFFQVFSTGTTDHRAESEAIVVLGAAQYDGRPSPQLQARLDHAVELWDEGVAPVVAVSGGKRPGDRFTEAETSRDYLVAKGVPADAIMMESAGTSTWASLQNLSGLFTTMQIEDVIIVTDPYHSLRSKLIAEELGLTAHVSPTRTSPVTGGANFWRHAREAAGVGIGRITGFGRLERLLG